MTENEKLRALLAEARAWVVAVQDDSLRERIDEALAEPVSDPVQARKNANGYDDLLAAYSLVITERDEARAAKDHFKTMLRERAAALLTAQEEIERLKLRFDAQWQECHDGSEGACCKAHE